jgi:hypothetical protein
MVDEAGISCANVHSLPHPEEPKDIVAEPDKIVVHSSTRDIETRIDVTVQEDPHA